LKSRIVFAVPGALDQVTGGYLYDRRVVEGLRARGRAVSVAELPGAFPEVDEVAVVGATALMRSTGHDDVVVVDGMALPAFESLIPPESGATVIGFVHHPLSLETGLSAERAAKFARVESLLWSGLDGVICASPSSARAVLASGVAADRIAVASPGVDLPADVSVRRRDATGSRAMRLLCVATLTARKGHGVLVDALSRIDALDWTLDCYGSLERDPATVHEVRRAIADFGLSDRIRLHGEQPADRLIRAWREADLFVLPSFHEGYGMVLTEALAQAIPVVSTRAGAIPETVPEAASRLVDPGDPAALAGVLAELMTEPAAFNRLAAAAHSARDQLASWPQAIDHWGRSLDRLAALGRVAA
jgi:glycosyltransferase involved in cell wall biosynthesis